MSKLDELQVYVAQDEGYAHKGKISHNGKQELKALFLELIYSAPSLTVEQERELEQMVAEL